MIRPLLIVLLLVSMNAIDITDDKFIWPGWGDVDNVYNFKTWSGYIPVGEVDDTRDLHYVFVESQSTHRDEDPIILWLNGGPGCSSLLGLMQEIGPFVIDNGETEYKANPWSWNLQAHLLILESPSGVGFSRSPKDAKFQYTDTKTGADNYKAIRMFFDTFTYYRGRAFWIAGESYAGMYIPYTASALVSGEVTVPEEDKINIKGIMIGNGVLVMNDEFRDKAATSFLTRRNFIDKTNQFILDHQCNINANSASCKIAKASLNKALDQINPYNVYGYCWSDSTSAEFKVPHSSKHPYTPWLSFYEDEEEEDENNAPCIDFGPLANKLNSDNVKQAMHVDESIIWTGCSDPVYLNYERDTAGSYYLLPNLSQNNLKILLFSGDQDLAVSMVETYNSIQQIPGIKELKQWTPYMNTHPSDLEKQLAGWTVEYDILTYWVIRGAGHMVPQDQRENAWFMMNKFISQ